MSVSRSLPPPSYTRARAYTPLAPPSSPPSSPLFSLQNGENERAIRDFETWVKTPGLLSATTVGQAEDLIRLIRKELKLQVEVVD